MVLSIRPRSHLGGGNLDNNTRLDFIRIEDNSLVSLVNPRPFAVRIVKFLGNFLKGIVLLNCIFYETCGGFCLQTLRRENNHIHAGREGSWAGRCRWLL